VQARHHSVLRRIWGGGAYSERVIYTWPDHAKDWDDRVRSHGVEVEWHERDAASREKVRWFLEAPYIGPFGCGTQRTFAEYEAYAGLSFLHRMARDATLRGEEPPNPPAPAAWATEPREWRVRIMWDRAALPSEALANPQFWYVGVHDANSAEIYREDAFGDEFRGLLQTEAREIVIERSFISDRQPATWTVWPTGCTGEWLSRIVGSAEYVS
jgi:hypothetical protein